MRKALTGLGRDPRRAPTIVKTGPAYDLDQLIAQAEQVTSRLYDLEGFREPDSLPLNIRGIAMAR